MFMAAFEGVSVALLSAISGQPAQHATTVQGPASTFDAYQPSVGEHTSEPSLCIPDRKNQINQMQADMVEQMHLVCMTQ